ncbi:MAG: hypothetical protein AMK71_02740 [Nitrospira bacterium SG8_35_4]|nr:MAG: hypothetical protein AMK71_02740 [Nitrospira bacterium SG8_35_4]
MTVAGVFAVSGAVTVNNTFASDLSDWMYDRYESELFGFMEARQGWRLQDDPHEEDETISEARFQLDLSKEFDFSFSPAKFMDVKAGRQIQTWGTGDLLFINDLFPKDWESFFTGRDDEYLKAPSDSIRTSFFSDAVNLDISYSPLFNGSNYIDGSRLSYWNGARIAGREDRFRDDERNRFLRDDEISMRISKTIEGIELALYGYNGFWQTPEGLDPDTGKGIYPRLRTVGGSARGPMLGGIGYAEAGYYDSHQDRDGSDPFIRNSEVRFLAGYERELDRNLTGGLQYYLEWMLDYSEYESSLLPGAVRKDEERHVLTLRLTRLMMNQNLKVSLFVYYSPSDQDAYFRPKIHYKVSDRWSIETGGNIFTGKDDHTFFAQFEDNTNAYAGARYSF